MNNIPFFPGRVGGEGGIIADSHARTAVLLWQYRGQMVRDSEVLMCKKYV